MKVKRMITLVSLAQTSIACPSQWEGKTDDSRWFYGRYRHGILEVSVGQINKTIQETLKSEDYSYIKQYDIGDELDGFMETSVLIGYMKNDFDFDCEIPDNDISADIKMAEKLSEETI